VTTAASSQADTVSAGHRPAAAAPAAATATTASPRPLPAGSSGTGSTARMPASRVKNPRTRPAEERNRRSLSRTVSCGTPLAAAIDRNRRNQHVLELAAIGAGVHAQPAAERAGDAGEEFEPGDPDLGREQRDVEVESPSTGHDLVALDGDPGKSATEAEGKTGNTAVAYQ